MKVGLKRGFRDQGKYSLDQEDIYEKYPPIQQGPPNLQVFQFTGFSIYRSFNLQVFNVPRDVYLSLGFLLLHPFRTGQASYRYLRKPIS